MSLENKIKLLLVDDEEKFLESIAKRLELKNFEVTTATNGQEAIAAAEKGLFDVAVVDFQMPGMDGTQVLKKLKENHKYIEIIMLTGHATIDSAVEATKLGAFKYLEKPYAFENLVEVMRPGSRRNSKTTGNELKKFKSSRSVHLLWGCYGPLLKWMTMKSNR